MKARDQSHKTTSGPIELLMLQITTTVKAVTLHTLPVVHPAFTSHYKTRVSRLGQRRLSLRHSLHTPKLRFYFLSLTKKKKKPLLPIFNPQWGQNRSKLLTTFRHCKPNAYHLSVLPTIDTVNLSPHLLTFPISMPPFLGVLIFTLQ